MNPNPSPSLWRELGLYYSITNVAALRLPGSDRRYPEWVAWCGLATCLLMAFSLQLPTILSGTGLLLVGFLFRFVLIKFRSRS
jgi:APA family basic amino acid/polyamine antiporter